MINFLENQKVFIRKRPLRFNRTAYYSLMRFPSYGDIISNNTIKEGLIKTYPINFTGRKIAKLFGEYITLLTYNNGQFIVRFNKNTELSEEIKNRFNAYGWFCSVETYEDGETTLVFEAKFQDRIKASEMPSDYSILIHVTPSYNKSKILQNGFSPRCKNEMFEYPGRIYFTPYTANPVKLKLFICQLWNKNRNKDRITDFTIFWVDTNKLGNVSFEVDENYEIELNDGRMAYGAYTTENIKPDSIIKHSDVNIYDLIKQLGITEDDLDNFMLFTNLLKNKK